MRLLTIIAVITLSVTLSTGASFAETYPSHTVKVLSGQAAGSGADSIVRFFSEELRQQLSCNIIVENKPGVYGSLAGETLAHAPPDGYTLLISGYPAVSSNAVLFSSLGYDPVKDFAPITTLFTQPFVLAVAPSLQVSTVQALTAFITRKGSRASYGSSNSSGLGLAELYKSAAGLQATGVPYRSSPEMMLDLSRGNIDFAFFDSGFAKEQSQGDAMREIAVTSAVRSSAWSTLPTMVEAGLPAVQLSSWFAAFAPAGTPPDVIERLTTAFSKILRSDEARKFAAALGADLAPGTPESLAQLQKEEIERWRHIMQVAHIKPQ